MNDEFGAPPKSGWAGLVPELLVENIEASLTFWCGLLQFEIAYQRPSENFTYLEHPGGGAQIMISQRSGVWETGPLERPFGRGVMFQVFVDDIGEPQALLAKAGWPLHAGPREVWRRYGDREGGKREILVLDPDGYLVMLAASLGERALRSTAGM